VTITSHAGARVFGRKGVDTIYDDGRQLLAAQQRNTKNILLERAQHVTLADSGLR